MIVTRLEGGLGNQLFQYAIGRCLAHKNRTDLKFDTSNYEQEGGVFHSKYKLGVFNIKERIARETDIAKTTDIKERPTGKEPSRFIADVFQCGDNKLLNGLWQCEKYFLDVEDIVRRELTLKKPLSKISAAWKEKILSADCAVSIHVRHGDYLRPHWRSFGVLALDYYQACVQKLKESFPNINLFVFSDDIEYCKENFKFGVPTEFVEGCEYDYEELHLMSCCKHHIISNSSFAWWGAWLNPNLDKKVFAPSPWFRYLDWRDIVPDSWIKIPVDYSSGIPPLLSIVLYIENNSATVANALQGVLSPIPIDYEVIVIDASTDGSGNICRRATQDPRVNFVRAKFPKNKFAAWNRGLDIAQGHYVSFLTAEDLGLPRIGIIAGICDDISFSKVVSKNTYLTYRNYWRHYPNVVSSTQFIVADDNGTVKLEGISDKKFSVKVDGAFQALNHVAEINLSAQQKLMALGSQSINGLVGTKIFKREFLKENNIRFNEIADVDAELTFVVETFLKSDKITFVPQIFYGRMK